MAGIHHVGYYDRKARQAPALIRARKPYLVKNAVTGLGIAGFAFGVYLYTMYKIGQDDFSDVKVPDAPRQPQESKTEKWT